MANEPDKGIQAAGNSTRTPGSRLQSERLRQEMTIQQAAQDLHLDGWVIEALEADDYAALGAPVFAKGHLRQYAGLLGMEPDELMIGYYQTRETPVEQPVIADVLKRREDSGPDIRFVVLAALTFLLLLAGSLVTWLLLSDNGVLSKVGPQAVLQTTVSTAFEDTAVANAVTDTVVLIDELPMPQTEVSAGSIIEITDSTPVPGAPVADSLRVGGINVLPAPTVALRLEFSEDSWVEIYDVEENRIYFALGKQDTETHVAGAGPLRILLGYADGVRLEVNGELYDIPANNRRGNTARFRVAAVDRRQTADSTP